MSNDRKYLVGGTILTMNPKGEVLENGYVEIEGGKISRIVANSAPPEGNLEIDCRECLILPGFINGHTHLGMSLLRGVADDLPLGEWLHKRIIPLENRLMSPEFVEAGSRLGVAELIRSGVTTFNDMYYHEEVTASVAAEAGMRGVCGYTVIEPDADGSLAGKFQEGFLEFYEKMQGIPRMEASLAPHAIYSLSPETLEQVVTLANDKNLVVHIHLSEVEDEVEWSLKHRGKRSVHALEDAGLWSLDRVIAAHVTCVDQGEVEVLGKYKVGVSHNPESNMKLGAKIAPVVALRKAGARVCVGTDGVASNNNLDLLEEVATAARLQSFQRGPGALKAYELVQMLTMEGARALGLEQEIGSLEVGKKADVVVIDGNQLHLQPLYDPYSQIVYGARGSDVKHSLVEGDVILKDFKLTRVDEASLLKEMPGWRTRVLAEIR